jgi:hypothetical protein
MNTVPTPARHTWADLLRSVGAVRRLAYDRSLEPDDAMRRIRDAFGEHDGRIDDEGERAGQAPAGAHVRCCLDLVPVPPYNPAA